MAFDLLKKTKSVKGPNRNMYIVYASTYFALPVRLAWRRIKSVSVIKMSTIDDKASPVVRSH